MSLIDLVNVPQPLNLRREGESWTFVDADGYFDDFESSTKDYVMHFIPGRLRFLSFFRLSFNVRDEMTIACDHTHQFRLSNGVL